MSDEARLGLEAIGKLEALAKVATNGPLDIERRDDDCGYMNYIVHGGKGDFAWCRDELDSKARHNADLIAALVNSAPELLAAARRALELEAGGYARDRRIREELLSVIGRQANSSHMSAVSSEWLYCWGPELESGRFRDIENGYGATERSENG